MYHFIYFLLFIIICNCYISYNALTHGASHKFLSVYLPISSAATAKSSDKWNNFAHNLSLLPHVVLSLGLIAFVDAPLLVLLSPNGSSPQSSNALLLVLVLL
eukprot:203855_1